MGNDYLQALANANDLAEKYLKVWQPNTTATDDDYIREAYFHALDLTRPGTREQQEVVFSLTDYYFKKAVLTIPLIKKQKRTLNSNEVKLFTDQIIAPLEGVIERGDCANKASYIRSKAEVSDLFIQELKKNGIEVKKDGCYIATAVYGSYDCPQVWILRRYCDITLAKTLPGLAFIRMYYAVSPTVVKLFGKMGWFQRFWLAVLNNFIEGLRKRGYDDAPYKH